MREQLHIQILEAISEIQFAYFNHPDPFHVFDLALNYLLAISQSQYGLIGERLLKNDGIPYLKIYAISNVSWNQHSSAFYAQVTKEGMEFTNLNSMLGWILINGQSIIADDPSHHPAAAGVPEGHPVFDNFLGLPIFFRDQFIGVVGLANKPGGYSDQTILFLQPLLNTIGNLINNIRLGREHDARLKLEERFRIIFNHSSDAFFLLDAEAVLDCNTTAVKMLRCNSKRQIINKPLHEFFPNYQPDERSSREKFFEMTQIAWRTGNHRFDWTNRTADNEYFSVEVTLNVVELSGRRALLVVWHDISKRKEYEDALINAKESAERAEQAKSHFLTSMSHELRTPMNSILGFTNRLIKKLEPVLEERDFDALVTIRRNAEHLLELINDILDLSKIEAGKMDLFRQEVDLHNLLGRLEKQMKPLSDAKSLALIAEPAPEGSVIMADQTRLFQILVNLVSNAIKYTDQGSVRIRLSKDHDVELGKVWRFEVSDTGVGVAEDDMARLFQKFTQLDQSVSRRVGGTGLGLAITSELVAMHQGRIEVESKLGEGSRFTVVLPVSPIF